MFSYSSSAFVEMFGCAGHDVSDAPQTCTQITNQTYGNGSGNGQTVSQPVQNGIQYAAWIAITRSGSGRIGTTAGLLATYWNFQCFVATGLSIEKIKLT
jgi:hypothetical protein